MPEEELAELKSKIHIRNAIRLLEGMKFNGGIYIKLGQHLSALGYILPLEWTETFRVLHDRCPSTSKDEVNDMLIKDFGKGIDEIFSEFDDEPIGVASIAQVHRARLRDSGQEVAVKLQHPKISRYSSFDLKTTTAIVKLAKKLLPNFEFSWLAEEMNQNMPIELNFKFEDENASRARENFANSKQLALKIPIVYWANRRMICMEFVTGAKLNDHVYMKKHGIDANQVSREITKIFSEMIYLHGWVHCDAHPGNLMIRASDNKEGFEVILLDHGLYRHLSEDFRFLYAKLWLSIIEKNTEKIREYSFLLGGTDATYKLITGILTGNSWSSIQPSDADQSTGKKDMSARFISLVPDIAHLLSQVPRELIFLFKTQDLLKLVHQDLGATQDQKVQYLIMARYCSEVIYQSHFSRTFKSPVDGMILFEKSIFSFMGAWLSYWGFRLQLKFYLFVLSIWPNFDLAK
ncbi:hypothetical protein DSO57_1039456 [Entomophthora muscae]|uniref:Uncharacterized protein n=1 Tax=Entomophthora muscae TaxID=34485 RepID=A0ACC2SBJ3_9FUNG|nr:hypothetical protein DSO57_1039456 [Entomophthora muscae]